MLCRGPARDRLVTGSCLSHKRARGELRPRGLWRIINASCVYTFRSRINALIMYQCGCVSVYLSCVSVNIMFSTYIDHLSVYLSRTLILVHQASQVHYRYSTTDSQPPLGPVCRESLARSTRLVCSRTFLVREHTRTRRPSRGAMERWTWR